MIMCTHIAADDELGMCRASLASPELSVLSILARCTDTTDLTVPKHNIIERRLRASRWAKPLAVCLMILSALGSTVSPACTGCSRASRWAKPCDVYLVFCLLSAKVFHQLAQPVA